MHASEKSFPFFFFFKFFFFRAQPRPVVISGGPFFFFSFFSRVADFLVSPSPVQHSPQEISPFPLFPPFPFFFFLFRGQAD